MAAFTVIGHTELSTAASAITFASISSSYDHLYLTASLRVAAAQHITDYAQPVKIELNNDSGANYSETYMKAGSTTVGGGRYNTGNGYFRMCNVASSLVDADCFAAWTLWIPNYSNTSNFKQLLFSGAVENASSTDYRWHLLTTAMLYHSTSAITQVELSAALFPAADFVQYSSATLYGVKGA